MVKQIFLILVLGLLIVAGNARATVLDSFDTNTIADYNVIDMYGGPAPANEETFAIENGAAKFNFIAKPAPGIDGKPGLYYPKVLMHKSETFEVGESVRVHVNLGTDTLYRVVSLVVSDRKPFSGWSSGEGGADFVGYVMARSPGATDIEVSRANGRAQGWEPIMGTGGYWGYTDYWMECKRETATSFSFSTSIDGGLTWQLINTDVDPTDANEDSSYSNIKYAGFAAEIPSYAWVEPTWGWETMVPPITLAVEDFQVLRPGQIQVCQQALAAGYSIPGDLNKDCYVNIKDIAVLMYDWMKCMNPGDTRCQ